MGNNKMRIALVHDWLTGMRGGEKVLEQLCAVFPSADIYTLLWVKGSVSPDIESHKITTSFLQNFPDIDKKYRYYLPLMPTAIKSLKLEGYDLVISSSHCVAKGISISGPAKHICYCYTPMRYIWDQFEEYFNAKRSGLLTNLAMRVARPFLQRWDLASNARVNEFVAISDNVKERIGRIYHRDSSVIYPPVDTKGYPPAFDGGYFLIVSALVPYKRTDLAIEAFNESGYPLKIIRSGPEFDRLKKMAKPNIDFLGWPGEDEIKRHYSGCRALIFAQEEDFGITAVEAQAAGKPVVAFARGGALETVIDGVTGVLFDKPDKKSLNDAVERLTKIAFSSERLKLNSERFSEEHFRNKIIDLTVKNC